MATTTPFDTIKPFVSSGLSEATILSTRLQMPILKNGQQIFPEKKAGSVPYNPECLKFVEADALKKTLLKDFTPSTEPVEMALPPIDARSPLLSEDDNRRDLSYKVYLPLSRLLQKKHRMSFSTDCPWQVTHGAADTRVIASKHGRKLVAIEEKSESLFQGLLVDELSFSDACKEGREYLNMGLNNQPQEALFACPLVLAQLLGYMKADQVAYGVIMTSGRAYFVWVSAPAQESKQPASDEGGQSAPKKQKVDNSDIFSNQGPGIYLSECMMVNDDVFLKVLYLFLVRANLSKENNLRGVAAGGLLALPSSQGGFLEGPEQQQLPETPIHNDDDQEEAPNVTTNSLIQCRMFLHSNGVKSRLPEDFRFPAAGLSDVWIKWNLPDQYRKIPPLRELQSVDYKWLDDVEKSEDEKRLGSGAHKDKRQKSRKIYYEMKTICNYIWKRGKELGLDTRDKSNKANIDNVYEKVAPELFALKQESSRNTQLKWRTIYNAHAADLRKKALAEKERKEKEKEERERREREENSSSNNNSNSNG